MRNDRVEWLGREGGETAQQLGRRSGGQRQVFEFAKRIDAILRRLDGNRIGHAVGRVQPVGRRRLRAARQRRLKAGSGIVFGQPDDAGEFAIEIDLQRGVLECFLDARIGDAGNVADLRQQLVGEGAAGVEIGAGDLHVDRRRRAEIEDLADDIRRKEGESRARKRQRQLLAQSLHIDVGGGRAFLQADQDVGVEDADRAGVAVRDVDAADRQADVVDDAREPIRRNDRADLLFDLIGQARRFLDSGSGRCAHVNSDRAGSTEGKKSCPRNGARPRDKATQRKPPANPKRCRSANCSRPR